jgi:hypothetical protein
MTQALYTHMNNKIKKIINAANKPLIPGSGLRHPVFPRISPPACVDSVPVALVTW